MTKSQKAKKQQFSDVQTLYGLKPDRWDNFVYTAVTGYTYRLKFQKQTIRLERKVNKTWRRLYTWSYLQVCISDISGPCHLYEAVQ